MVDNGLFPSWRLSGAVLVGSLALAGLTELAQLTPLALAGLGNAGVWSVVTVLGWRESQGR